MDRFRTTFTLVENLHPQKCADLTEDPNESIRYSVQQLDLYPSTLWNDHQVRRMFGERKSLNHMILRCAIAYGCKKWSKIGPLGWK